MQNLPCHCAESMGRLLLTISRVNGIGINSELPGGVIGVLEQALSVARASLSTVAPTNRCQFCPLSPEITRYDTCFVLETLTCSLESALQKVYRVVWRWNVSSAWKTSQVNVAR